MIELQTEYGQVLDVEKDIPISLNYSIADVKEPNKRNTSFSKTINLVGSKNNNDILQHIYEIDISGGFNPNAKLGVSLLQDGVDIINGYMQLINIIKEEKQILYQVTIIGETGGLFSQIEGLLLKKIEITAVIDKILISLNQD